MRVLFLDIDGVLNSHQSAIWAHEARKVYPKEDVTPEYLVPYLWNKGLGDMCPIATSNLNYILRSVKDLKIVLSSTWRLGASDKEIKQYFAASKLIQQRYIDSTPTLKDAQRGDEIKRWIINQTTKISDFVVIDDDRDMDAVEDNFFHIDNRVGLDWNKACDIVNYLGAKD